jgi:hypothetical protein
MYVPSDESERSCNCVRDIEYIFLLFLYWNFDLFSYKNKIEKPYQTSQSDILPINIAIEFSSVPI